MNIPIPPLSIGGPAQIAELLPFLLNHRPEDSIIVHSHTRVDFFDGPTMTVQLLEDPATWTDVADAFAHHFIDVMRQRGHILNTITIYLCRDPRPGQTAEYIAAQLRPAADRIACTLKDYGVRIHEIIGLVNDRWWAYQCPRPHCCEGQPLPALDAPDSLTAGLIRLGITPGRRTSEIASEFRPITTNATRYREALDAVAADLHEQTQTYLGQSLVREGTVRILNGALKDTRNGNVRLDDEVAARIIVGLQDTKACDHAILTHSEDDDLPHARSLYSYLARRCVPPHTDKAPPLLTLLGWIAWRQGDKITARIAFKDALTTDNGNRMAKVLHAALNNGTDPQELMKVNREVNAELLADDETDTTP